MRHISGTEVAFPSVTWLRSHRADPPVVLVITPTGGAAPAEDPTGEQLASALFGLGFATVIDPDAALPRIARLTAHRDGERLLVDDHHCDLLFQAALEPGRPWPRAAEAGRRIGVLFVAGGYPPPAPTVDHRAATTVDHRAALAGTAAAGNVIGGAIRLTGSDRRRTLGIRRPRWLGGAHPAPASTACPGATAGASWSP